MRASGTVTITETLARNLAPAAVAALIAACDCDCPQHPAAVTMAGAAKPDGAPVPLFTCRNGRGPQVHVAMGQPLPETDETVTATIAEDFSAARAARAKWQGHSFDEFVQAVRRECGPNGKFLVDGDVAMSDVEQLHEFFEQRIQGIAPPADANAASMWPAPRKRTLTYCVSTAFGQQHDKVVADMESATGAWEQAASVDFSHVDAQDASCDAQNEAVAFDVNPVDVDGGYLARAFSPGERRADRNVYIDLTALGLDPAQELQLSGVLRHALGHVLGFHHEHTRPGSGARTAPSPNNLVRIPRARVHGRQL